MDEFINNEYTFLILDTYSFSFVVSSEVYEYESICGDLTMTQLRREDWGSRTVRYFKNHKIYEKQFSKGDKPQNLTQSLLEFWFEHENEKMQTDEIYLLKHPVILSAQTFWNINFAKYGDTTTFYIIGLTDKYWVAPA